MCPGPLETFPLEGMQCRVSFRSRKEGIYKRSFRKNDGLGFQGHLVLETQEREKAVNTIPTPLGLDE